MTIQTLNNKSRYDLYLNGTQAYMTIDGITVPNHTAKKSFHKLIANKPNFTVLLNNDTVKKYVSKIEELGFRLIEQIEYNSFETRMYFEAVCDGSAF